MGVMGGIMVVISYSWTRRAAWIFGCVLLPLLRTASIAPPPTVDVSVTGLRSERGQILVCLTPNRKAFPDCSKDAGSVRMAVKAADAGHFAVHAPPAGTYAIPVVHDANSNNKMDEAIFVPTEGFVTGRAAGGEIGG